MAYSQISKWLDFEIRAEGSNDNGGAFASKNNADSSTGTDRSQQDDPHVEIGGGTVTAVCATGGDRDSIILSNYTCSSADVGNCVQIVSAASGVFTGLYYIESVTGTDTWNFSNDCRDSTGDATPLGITTANMGGAWTGGLGFWSSKQDVWFDDGQAFAVWIKAGSYPWTSTDTSADGGSLVAGGALSASITGYTSERGDAREGGALPVWDVASTGFTGKMIDLGSAASTVEINFLVLDGGGTATYGVYGDGAAVGHSCCGVTVRDLNTTSGWAFYYPLTCVYCQVSGAYGGYGHAVASANCYAEDCAGFGFKDSSRYVGYGNIAHDCDIGFQQDSFHGLWVNCVADDCVTGFSLIRTSIHQCVATNCLHSFAADVSYYSTMFSCAGYNNTNAPQARIAVNSDYTTLTADPWEDQSASPPDFRLNDTAGGGAALRGRGYAYPTQTAVCDTSAFITARSGGGSSVFPAYPHQSGT